ncbi:putative Anaphase-promoting complex subunit 2 [Glarea lozoyensis 74030]|uniref:Anaphase-promoting complex subunit 2 n=1 Tax=Glarea lozoyensis (strain ATCC 74030 / MF5533) TaxID=1104152 RepID=H0EL14_GLAL7|nr:putative Anaphase-promoting complex subunit 2 [Glarea lozoyensis 74030]
MFRDIQNSTSLNLDIRHNKSLEPSNEEREVARTNVPEKVNPEGLHKPSLHAKILSRLFWPQLQDDTYNIPTEITNLQAQYEEGFETLQSSRKLTWLPALGQATVELEFEDRTIIEEVHTWQATVIWAFQSPSGDPITHTLDTLTTQLEMDEPLLRAALKFWVAKLVLHSPRPGVYTPLETLNTTQQQATTSQPPDEPDAPAANTDKENEKMAMYWQFIQGMLKNSSSQMPLQQISMMLKICGDRLFMCPPEILKNSFETEVVSFTPYHMEPQSGAQNPKNQQTFKTRRTLSSFSSSYFLNYILGPATSSFLFDFPPTHPI